MKLTEISNFITKKRGDGSAIPLFWILPGILVIAMMILSLFVFVPRDNLRGHVIGNSGLYVHFSDVEILAKLNDERYGFLALNDLLAEEAAFFMNDDGRSAVIIRLEDLDSSRDLIEHGFRELGAGLFIQGDDELFSAKNVGSAKLYLWPISGELISATGNYVVAGKIRDNEFLSFITKKETPFFERLIMGGLVSCKNEKVDDLFGVYRFIGSTKKYNASPTEKAVVAQKTIQLLFSDIEKKAANFSAYDNPFVSNTRNELHKLFERPLSVAVDSKENTLVVLYDTKPIEAREKILEFTRTSLPIVEQKFLPDGTSVKEFVLSESAFAWSETNENGVTHMVSKDSEISLWFTHKDESVILSTSEEMIHRFISEEHLDLISKIGAWGYLDIGNETYSGHVNNLLSTFSFSTIYSHTFVDKSVVVCGSIK